MIYYERYLRVENKVHFSRRARTRAYDCTAFIVSSRFPLIKQKRASQAKPSVVR